MCKEKRTPTPWRLEKAENNYHYDIVSGYDTDGTFQDLVVENFNSEMCAVGIEDAQHIVNCVNQHEALQKKADLLGQENAKLKEHLKIAVEGLKEVQAEDPAGNRGIRYIADEALAKIKGE